MNRALNFQFIFLFIGLLAFPSKAELLVLKKSETREYYSFIQLQHGLGEGKIFAEIFDLVRFKKDKIAIRLLGEFSEKANAELLEYYKKEIPLELKEAKASSGHLHDPKLEPLIKQFKSALKETTIYNEIEAELLRSGYKIESIRFEKYTFKTNHTPRLFVADIWLHFIKTPNKTGM